jgi:ribonuclease P protein component
MLPKNQRIDRRLFSSIFRKGKRAHSFYFTLVFTPSFDDKSHISFVASKKAIGNAVARNTLRRRGYNAIRHLLPLFKYPSVCILYFKPTARSASFSELENDIKDLLYGVRVLEPKV